MRWRWAQYGEGRRSAIDWIPRWPWQYPWGSAKVFRRNEIIEAANFECVGGSRNWFGSISARGLKSGNSNENIIRNRFLVFGEYFGLAASRIIIVCHLAAHLRVVYSREEVVVGGNNVIKWDPRFDKQIHQHFIRFIWFDGFDAWEADNYDYDEIIELTESIRFASPTLSEFKSHLGGWNDAINCASNVFISHYYWLRQRKQITSPIGIPISGH